jgi:hypothetical protein
MGHSCVVRYQEHNSTDASSGSPHSEDPWDIKGGSPWLVGILVAAVAKGREMTSTMAFGLFLSALGVSGALIGVAKTPGDGDYGFLWELPWIFASSIAALVGGAIVRTRRSGATIRPSVT